MNAAIEALHKFSLIKRDPDVKTLTIHRLVQVVIKDGMDQDTQRQWAERAVRAVSEVFPSGEYETWTDCERCLPHAQICADYIKQRGMIFPEAAQLLNRTGYYLYKRGQYEQAQPLLELCLRIRKKLFAPEHFETARILTDLGRLYFAQGRYKRAEPLLCRALSIRKPWLEPHSDYSAYRAYTARSYNNVAELYRKQGRYQEADPLYQQAQAIYEQVRGPEHPDTARVINNRAKLYHEQGEYTEAEPLYQGALAIREKQLRPEHPDTANNLNDLAELYHEQGKYAEAEPLYNRALKIMEKQLGPDHPDTTKVRESYNALDRDMKRKGKRQQH